MHNSLSTDILKISSFRLKCSLFYGLYLFKTFIISWNDTILWIKDHLVLQSVWIFFSLFEWGFIFSNKLRLKNGFVMNKWLSPHKAPILSFQRNLISCFHLFILPMFIGNGNYFRSLLPAFVLSLYPGVWDRIIVNQGN